MEESLSGWISSAEAFRASQSATPGNGWETRTSDGCGRNSPAWFAYFGEWSEYHGNYRFQRLEGGDHTAIGDAKACLAVIREMAASGSNPIGEPREGAGMP